MERSDTEKNLGHFQMCFEIYSTCKVSVSLFLHFHLQCVQVMDGDTNEANAGRKKPAT